MYIQYVSNMIIPRKNGSIKVVIIAKPQFVDQH